MCARARRPTSWGRTNPYGFSSPPSTVAWLLGDKQQELEAALDASEVAAAAARLQRLPAWEAAPAAVVCKAGQRVRAVWERAAVDSNSNPRTAW